MITWSDGTTSTGTSYLDSNRLKVEEYALECEEFSHGVLIVRVYISPYFTIMTDYFRTLDEANEFKQFIRDLMALRFPDAKELALQQLKGE